MTNVRLFFVFSLLIFTTTIWGSSLFLLIMGQVNYGPGQDTDARLSRRDDERHYISKLALGEHVEVICHPDFQGIVVENKIKKNWNYFYFNNNDECIKNADIIGNTLFAGNQVTVVIDSFTKKFIKLNGKLKYKVESEKIRIQGHVKRIGPKKKFNNDSVLEKHVYVVEVEGKERFMVYCDPIIFAGVEIGHGKWFDFKDIFECYEIGSLFEKSLNSGYAVEWEFDPVKKLFIKLRGI
jgi:hypothetical protein